MPLNDVYLIKKRNEHEKEHCEAQLYNSPTLSEAFIIGKSLDFLQGISLQNHTWLLKTAWLCPRPLP